VNVPQYLVTVEMKIPDPPAPPYPAALPSPPMILDAKNTYFEVVLPLRTANPAGGSTGCLGLLLRALLSLVILVGVVLGGSYGLGKVPPTWWDWLNRKLPEALMPVSQNNHLLQRLAGTVGGTVMIVLALAYHLTGEAQQARQGTPGPWYSVLWTYPSALVAAFSRWLGGIGQQTSASTAVLRPPPAPPTWQSIGSGLLAVLMLAGFLFGSTWLPDIPWVRAHLPQLEVNNGFLQQVFAADKAPDAADKVPDAADNAPDAADNAPAPKSPARGMVTLPGLVVMILGALGYVAKGRPGQPPAAQGLRGVLMSVLGFIPDRIITGIKGLLTLLRRGPPPAQPTGPPAAGSPPVAAGSGAWTGGPPPEMTIAWVGIEV
jgi:hypothetical protein